MEGEAPAEPRLYSGFRLGRSLARHDFGRTRQCDPATNRSFRADWRRDALVAFLGASVGIVAHECTPTATNFGPTRRFDRLKAPSPSTLLGTLGP